MAKVVNYPKAKVTVEAAPGSAESGEAPPAANAGKARAGYVQLEDNKGRMFWARAQDIERIEGMANKVWTQITFRSIGTMLVKERPDEILSLVESMNGGAGGGT